jgi:hypothetical protein
LLKEDELRFFKTKYSGDYLGLEGEEKSDKGNCINEFHDFVFTTYYMKLRNMSWGMREMYTEF